MRTIVYLFVVWFFSSWSFGADFTLSCRPESDLLQAMKAAGMDVARYDAPAEAVERAQEGKALLILAQGYPERRTDVNAEVLAAARGKKLRTYVEFPQELPGTVTKEVKLQQAGWERVVVARDGVAEGVEKLRILHGHQLQFLPVSVADEKQVWLSIARVAGYDTAVFGLPKNATPLLFQMNDRTLVSTSRLSEFVTGRFAPVAQWKKVWVGVLRWLGPDAKKVELTYQAPVRPALGPDEKMPAGFERECFDRGAVWFGKSRLLLSPHRQAKVHELLLNGVENTDMPAENDPDGDGSMGILEGYSSAIRPDGTQGQRAVLRSDCNTESAMVFALDSLLNKKAQSAKTAGNLLDWVYFKSNICKGERGDPKHPSFGHIAWGDVSPAWLVANYGDDDARCILATLTASSALKDERWNASVLRSLLANLRTTGKLGFRGDRVDVPALEQNGWRHFHDAETVNYAPHFEAALWACNLWAYARTGEKEFLEKTRTAIRMTMAAYPKQWRWGDNIERARMLHALAWLVRVEDTAEHRTWLKTIATDLLNDQDTCGAIAERLRGTGGGHFQIPQSNEAYGTGETPLIQSNRDKASDQLYTTGFALLALHEAVGATKDPTLLDAENRLAAYLCRIQSRSEKFPWLDGAWFRAFDFGKWDYWSSSADVGWGAWSIEAGWAQAWTAATLALREQKTTLWEFTAGNSIAKEMEKVRGEMGQNLGKPFAN
ncbi:MAG TPA: hypothetical protein VF669_22845 [Tepidisphaeraceae bacterium]|jgi:hypothetical protein